MVTMVHVTAEHVAESMALVQAHSDRGTPSAMRRVFVVMERLGLRGAISFDEHFRQHGRFALLE
jgi:predicted nucleic acid-binding protein